jgi:hypothetical protein
MIVAKYHIKKNDLVAGDPRKGKGKAVSAQGLSREEEGALERSISSEAFSASWTAKGRGIIEKELPRSLNVMLLREMQQTRSDWASYREG